MQATWSNTDSKESASIAFEDARYDPNDLLAFTAFMELVHDGDDDDEFTNEHRAKFLSNLIVEHERQIKSYMKNMISLMFIKT